MVNKAHLEGIIVRPLKPGDITQLKPILEEHVRDRNTGEIITEEVTNITRCMSGLVGSDGRVRKYLVAEHGGRILGCMGWSEPDGRMLEHIQTTTADAAEALNAFVAREVFRGGGVGRQLFRGLCQAVRDEGKTLLVANSGPRYETSWPIHDHFFSGLQEDGRTGLLNDYYGPGGHAMTWVKHLHPF